MKKSTRNASGGTKIVPGCKSNERPEYEAPGKIKKIIINNFMCHERLEFVFGDRISFISGKNGSGKSAILTAIMIGLGGKTADTKRGSTLKSLIKSGKQRAVIQITLSNPQGKMLRPYKHDLYGDEITIVRTISEKSSTYRLFSYSGSLVESTIGDLKKILCWFNIQVNNPVAILTQETARTFMTSAEPKKLYDFFMKGTLLEEIKIKHALIASEKLPIVDNALLLKKKQLEVTSKDIIETKKNFDKLRELHKCSVDVVEVERELAWAVVHELKQHVQEEEQNKNETEKELEKLKEIVEKREVFENKLNENKRTLETAFVDIKNKVKAIDVQVDDTEKCYASERQQHHNVLHEIKRLKKQIVSETNNCKELEGEIEKERSRSVEAETRRKKNEEKKVNLKKKIEETAAVKRVNENDRQQFFDTVRKLQNDLEIKESRVSHIANNIERKKSHLKILESETNELSVFSTWMPALVDALKKATAEGKLTKMPRGPVGKYIKVIKEGWAPVIENFLSPSALKSFCLNDNNDWYVFKDIALKLNIPFFEIPTVMISAFTNEQYNTKENEAKHPEYVNLMEAITFSDPVIANAVIDYKQIENVLLIPKMKEACELLSSMEGNIPVNCHKALTLKGDVIHAMPDYRIYSGHSSTYKVKYLQVNRESAIRLIQEELENLNAELSAAKKEVDDAKEEVKAIENKAEVLRRTMENLSKEINSYERLLVKLDDEEDMSDININVLSEDIDYRKNLIKQWEITITQNDKEQNDIFVKLSDLKQKIEDLKTSKANFMGEKSSIEEKLVKVNKELSSVTAHWKYSKIAYVDKQKLIEEIRKKLLKKQEECEKAEIEAEKSCPEISDTRDVQTLKNKSSELKSVIKALEGILKGNVFEVAEEYESKLEMYEKISVSIQNLTGATEELRQFLEVLRENFLALRRVTCKSIKDIFLIMLSIRGYKGRIAFDHDNKELSIHVQTNVAAKNPSDASGLSGGERSFCMVSFIMALWKNMNLPFYFLDEFDVFMDPVNRQTALHLLVDHAKERPDQQFIFLTPHATNYDESFTEAISLFRMEDPRS